MLLGLFQALIPFFEIVTIAILFNFLLSFFWNTRAMDLAFGFLAFLLIFVLVSWLNLPVLEKLMFQIVNVAVFAILIIFQPELRLALAKLSFKSKKYRASTEFEHFLENIAFSVYRLAEKKVGALIVLENQETLDEYVKKSVVLNADFSSELLESVFMTTTPLHDGAVIIRNSTILSAATILPLAEDTFQVTKSMGTRHRAGLGMSQTSDAIIIVVSEESGKVSLAREGIMTRGIKVDRFKGILRSVFTVPHSMTTTLPKKKTLPQYLMSRFTNNTTKESEGSKA
ncbi:MAG: TIGR00159 family protein [Waddliaceae bacterium]|jgi:diadenylate cyclase|nr:TIGR00159 family protein [Waddliaceae bacterium]MBT3578778.1 TIGR00159 family protein [Waddliaceae bacterium]MBT4445323.1 TIGR00159 family protein [Waddliaceae bacterium]MBT6928619.1 TIGR00159 family protein [Waddliaceae bacterium]MBT7265117.1 TIGR00159 family protein [Waddliaceae bacterium]